MQLHATLGSRAPPQNRSSAPLLAAPLFLVRRNDFSLQGGGRLVHQIRISDSSLCKKEHFLPELCVFSDISRPPALFAQHAYGFAPRLRGLFSGESGLEAPSGEFRGDPGAA
jgi:hypothetical protein